MQRDPFVDAAKPKLGKTVAADGTLDGTVRTMTLSPGMHTIECSVKGYALQCKSTVATPSTALLRAQGVRCPADTEVEFWVEGDSDGTALDGKLVFVKDSASSDGTVRVLNMSVPIVVDLS